MRAALVCCVLPDCQRRARAPHGQRSCARQDSAALDARDSARTRWRPSAIPRTAMPYAAGARDRRRRCKADARRESGSRPCFPAACAAMNSNSAVQLALARAAFDSKAYRALARRISGGSRPPCARRLAIAQANGKWRKRFGHLGHWIDDWERATDPDVRELLRRTLVDQAIRASLSSFEGAKVYGQARPTAALKAYDEYIFNRMCTADEDNLNWLKGRIATRRLVRYPQLRRGRRQCRVAAGAARRRRSRLPGLGRQRCSSPRSHSGDTNPQNFAFLSDRIAVRDGAPQRFATQMECVDGNGWRPGNRVSRRSSMRGAPPWGWSRTVDQLARRKHLCHVQAAAHTRSVIARIVANRCRLVGWHAHGGHS